MNRPLVERGIRERDPPFPSLSLLFFSPDREPVHRLVQPRLNLMFRYKVCDSRELSSFAVFLLYSDLNIGLLPYVIYMKMNDFRETKVNNYSRSNVLSISETMKGSDDFVIFFFLKKGGNIDTDNHGLQKARSKS